MSCVRRVQLCWSVRSGLWATSHWGGLVLAGGQDGRGANGQRVEKHEWCSEEGESRCKAAWGQIPDG